MLLLLLLKMKKKMKNIKSNQFYKWIGIENKCSEMTEDNVSYKLFTIGQLTEQNELMKNITREYKILVRTKTHGFEVRISYII